MDIKEIYRVRIRALNRLIAQYENRAKFCSKFGFNDEFYGRVLKEKKPFGEKLARTTEERMGLDDFYLDKDLSDFHKLTKRDMKELNRFIRQLVADNEGEKESP